MARSPAVPRSKKPRLLKDYRSALLEYRRLANYLRGATGALSKAEFDLLVEFAEISKRKCQRLRRALNRLGKHRSAA